MGLHEIELKDADEIEAFYLQTTGMKPDYLQLSAGPAGMNMKVIELDGVTLVWATVHGRTRWRDQITGDGLHLGFAFDSAGPVLVRGRELSGNEAQVWLPGEEMEYVLNGPVQSLEVSVDRATVDALGWQFSGDPLRPVGKAALKRLVALCRLASRVSEVPACHQRDQILDELERMLQPWIASSTAERTMRSTRGYQLLKATERYFDTLRSDEKLNIDHMAQEIGYSRRSVFHAYRRLLGIGPRRYLELMRLQQLRQRLKLFTPEQTSVTAEAARLGFFHPGRMPLIYRRQFGENPVKTLRNGSVA